MELKIRMSDELYLLILRTAEYVRIKPAEVLQAAIRGYVTNRPVAHYAIRETCYKSRKHCYDGQKNNEPGQG